MARKQLVAVLGGGIAGIAATLRLLSAGARVRLYEEADSLGGLYRAFDFGDAKWDRHPHRILTTDTQFLDLLDELGVGSKVKWAEGKIGLRIGKKTWSLATAKDVRQFTPLTFFERLKMGYTVYKAAKGEHPTGIENQTAREWVTAQAGANSWTLVFEPLLRLLLGDAADKASALFLRECMRRAAVSKYGSKERQGYGYVLGGLRTAWEKAAAIFAEKKMEMALKARVKQVRLEGTNRVVVETEGGEVRDFDEVFITYPEPEARRILHPSIPQTGFGGDLPYLGLVSMACIGDWSLSDHAITYHTHKDIPFSGIVEMTRLTPTIEIAGRHLMFLMRFGQADDAMLKKTDQEISNAFFDGLEKMYDLETRDGVREHWLFREPAFRPLPVVGMKLTGEPAVTPAPGVHCLNTRLLHFGAADGEGGARLGREVAEKISAGYDPAKYPE
jgi:protoporphyrinogen oxidase